MDTLGTKLGIPSLIYGRKVSNPQSVYGRKIGAPSSYHHTAETPRQSAPKSHLEKR
jgi:hypothetical protein